MTERNYVALDEPIKLDSGNLLIGYCDGTPIELDTDARELTFGMPTSDEFLNHTPPCSTQPVFPDRSVFENVIGEPVVNEDRIKHDVMDEVNERLDYALVLGVHRGYDFVDLTVSHSGVSIFLRNVEEDTSPHPISDTETQTYDIRDVTYKHIREVHYGSDDGTPERE